MATDNILSPSELADEARQFGGDALQAAQGYAQESGRIGGDALRSIRASVEDAREMGGRAADTAAAISADVKDVARDAGATGRAYARDAVHAAGQKIRHLKERVGDAKANCAKYVADEPVRASLIAIAAGALATTMLLFAFRRSRRQ